MALLGDTGRGQKPTANKMHNSEKGCCVKVHKKVIRNWKQSIREAEGFNPTQIIPNSCTLTCRIFEPTCTEEMREEPSHLRNFHQCLARRPKGPRVANPINLL